MYEYIGNGNYLEGIPARDLSEDEAALIDEELLALAIDLGLYKKPKQKPQKSEETVND